MKNLHRFIIFLILSPLSIYAFGTEKPEKVYLEIDPLLTPVRAIELRDFNTVGDAARYFTSRVGYSFVTAPPAPVDSNFIADLPIKPSAITPEIKPLQELLLHMVNKKYVLIVDHKNRKVSYGLAKEKSYVKATTLNNIFEGKYIVPQLRRKQ